MTPLLAAAAEAQQFLHGSGERFCFIGGLAVQRWGEPRFTRDVDLTLLCELGSEQRAVDLVLSGFRARISDAREFALRQRVVLVQASSDFPIDIALGALPFEHRCVERSSLFDFGPGARLRTCSAEDLIVLKAFAGRLQDWADIEKVLVRQRAVLDWNLVRDELKPLLALREAPERLDQLDQMRSRFK